MQDDVSYLAGYDASAFDRPSVTVDVVLLTAKSGALHALLHERRQPPMEGCFGLPGGFVGIDEYLEHAARRLLRDKGGVEDVFLEQLYTFGNPNRDPRTRVISVAYYALVNAGRLESDTAVSKAAFFPLSVPWEGETGGPVLVVGPQDRPLPLAFDHVDILGMAVKRIRGKLNYTPIGFQLLPDEFTLRALQDVHETILGRAVNKDSFRRRMLASGQLEAKGERERDVGHRPAELYRFTRRSAI